MKPNAVLVMVITMAWALFATRGFDRYVPARWHETMAVALIAVTFGIIAWRVRTGRMPPLKFGPGKKAMRKLLVWGLVLVPLSFAWLIGGLWLTDTWSPGASLYFTLFPFLALAVSGSFCLSRWSTSRFYRSIGLAQGAGD